MVIANKDDLRLLIVCLLFHLRDELKKTVKNWTIPDLQLKQFNNVWSSMN